MAGEEHSIPQNVEPQQQIAVQAEQIYTLRHEIVELYAIIRALPQAQQAIDRADHERIWKKLSELQSDLKWISNNYTIASMQREIDEIIERVEAIEDHPSLLVPALQDKKND